MVGSDMVPGPVDFLVLAIISGIVGWAVIEGLIWVGSVFLRGLGA